MTIFGVPWHMLELEHVRRFLADAGPEPLFWKAKGTELSRSEVRLQACGFANSHDGGFLILGVSETNVVWTLDGVAFPSDPTTWISEVVGNGGVNPYPDGLDTRAFRVAGDRWVAVVSIPPVSTPPCNTGGRVYERVSGRTIPVREPLRLAALFERGDQARIAASTRANAAAKSRCCGRRTVTTARAGTTRTPFCTMPRFLRTMWPLLLRGLRPRVTGTPRRCWGLDLVRSWPR